MPAEVYNIHYETPEKNKIVKIINILNDGGVILYPTDTGYSLGCKLSNKEGIAKLRRIRNISLNHPLTFLCEDLSHISDFAKVSNEAYRIIKHLIPGPYTFILPATKSVPKYTQNPKRKTAGIRVPNDRLSQALLIELGEPLISTTAKIDDDLCHFPEDFIEKFKKLVDVSVKTNEYNFTGESTVIDMIKDEFKIIREGAGFDEVKEYIDY